MKKSGEALKTLATCGLDTLDNITDITPNTLSEIIESISCGGELISPFYKVIYKMHRVNS